MIESTRGTHLDFSGDLDLERCPLRSSDLRSERREVERRSVRRTGERERDLERLRSLGAARGGLVYIATTTVLSHLSNANEQHRDKKRHSSTRENKQEPR